MKENIVDRCLDTLKTGNFTADEIAAKTGDNILAMRPTVCVLFKEGHLRKTGERRPNTTGKPANVWMLKDATVSLVPQVDPEVAAFITHALNLGFSKEDIKNLAPYPADKIALALA